MLPSVHTGERFSLFSHLLQKPGYRWNSVRPEDKTPLALTLPQPKLSIFLHRTIWQNPRSPFTSSWYAQIHKILLWISCLSLFLQCCLACVWCFKRWEYPFSSPPDWTETFFLNVTWGVSCSFSDCVQIVSLPRTGDFMISDIESEWTKSLNNLPWNNRDRNW